MPNWDAMQTTAAAAAANHVEHNNWYSNMFAANIKTEPGTQQSSPSSSASSNTHLENYLKQQQQQNQHQQFTPMDTNMNALTSTATNNQNISASNGEQQHQQQQYFDTAGMHQQLLQQHHYQQHFQQAQQAAAQNQASSHLPLGFNPLTPPGLPQAIIPTISHFYNQSTQKLSLNRQQAPSPQTLLENSEKSTLTPSNTPPMDITPPKSPKATHPVASTSHEAMNGHHQQQDQELASNSSEDLKYIVESDNDESIRMPIYNSHGKMKKYKCKTCGMVSVTKVASWEHARTHMKPEKMLECTNCPFATELKHHLEYHTRKHKNLKPFQCDKCPYSCVNKSMLNSHRKSHSSVYQYRCVDCEYATKYCHSFKLHLRKYDHKQGTVLDEDGIPNPSVVIDVYGTRRGPKNKASSTGAIKKKSNTDFKISTSQLSAALQGFAKTQMPASPVKSTASATTSDLPSLTISMPLQQQQQRQQQQSSNTQSSPSSQQSSPAAIQNGTLSNMMPPLASLLQQNPNMAFLPYWNLNLQMLAAQQQAAALAQLSPNIREQLQKNQINEQNNGNRFPKEMDKSDNDDDDDDNDNDDEDDDQPEDEDQEFDRKSVDSAMDLSQGTPTKDDQQKQTPPQLAINLKLPEDNIETPVYATLTSNRRKGRVLKLDPEQLKNSDTNSSTNSPEETAPIKMGLSNVSSTKPPANKTDDSSLTDESMETGPIQTNNNPPNPTSTASSSGNSSNSSSAACHSNNSTANSSASTTPTMFECKYCDIFFKDAVLYTIHMGYHSCDDVFKCNMCGEKCDGPVGLFVHMARNAHS